MKLSVIVLTHNRRAALRTCLESILAHTALYAKGQAEIIVVNNGSDDGTRELLEDCKGKGYQLIPINRKTNEGVCARNHAIDIARGEFIAQVDDDVRVHPKWDEVLLAPFDMSSEIGATGQHGFYQNATWERTPYSAGLIDDRRRPAPGQYADLVMGFCWAFRRYHFPEMHDDWMDMPVERRPLIMGEIFRYDEAFNPFWHEESDLQLQIRAAGYRIMVTPEVATHNSLHDWKATMANEGATAEQQAERNFYRLKDKWQAKNVRFEGSLVGLS